MSPEQVAEEIFFCGDPHGSFDHILQAAKEHRPKAMVILGDLQPPAPLHEVLADILSFVEVWWIPGNHDTDNDLFYDRLWRSELAGHNLHGRVALVNGVRIAGLGGVFRGQIWMPPQAPNYMSAGAFIRRIGRGNMWRGGLPRRHRTSIFPSTYDNLMDHKADVLVTHEAPGCHRKGFLAIDQLAKKLQVKYLFHGHQHEDRHYPTYYGFTPRGVGYRGIVNLRGDDIVPAQIDPREAMEYAEQAQSLEHYERLMFKRLG
ncbi:MAG TPA: metallophosphoesterase [Candidatus Aphodousia faecalis]|nr:metallophosphoesterase [Candidatus Aphodousia faecalis]